MQTEFDQMRFGFRASILVAVMVAAGLLISRIPSKAQARGAQAPVVQPAAQPAAQAAYRAPRTADGKPDLNGIWQALNEADWDLQPHAASQGPVFSLGAVFSVPPSAGVVDGNEIPYLPAAAAKKKENQANWVKLDPEVKCYLPGIPRAAYLPYPFQIVQSQQNILMSYEYAGAVRIINMGAPTKAPADSWMGWSNGQIG